MSYLKHLLVFLFLIGISSTSFATTKVIFLNGIDGFPEKNYQSMIKLSEILATAGYGRQLSSQGVGFRFWSNPGDGSINDKLELLAQAKLSGEALGIAKIYNPNAIAQSQEYFEILGNLYKNKISSGAAETETDTHIYATVRDLSQFISDEVLVKNNKILIVSHSQGNFFAEAVAAYLTVTKSVPENAKLDSNLRFVGVASVAASTPHYRYLSAREDIALQAHTLLTGGILNFSILPTNVVLCSILSLDCSATLQATYDLAIHGFQEVYTSNLVDRETNKPLYKLLADLISESLNELNPPAPVPRVINMTPVDAVVGETRSFSITGANLPTADHLDVTFDGCANIVFAPGQTANLHQFTCVPLSAGTITAVIRTLPRAVPLGTYTVSVAAAPGAVSGVWMGWDGTRFTTAEVEQKAGYITKATSNWGVLRLQLNNVVDGDNLNLIFRAKNDPALGGSYGNDLEVTLGNDFGSGQFDSAGTQVRTREITYVETNGYFLDFFVIASSTGNSGRIYQTGALDTTSWHTYTLNVKNNVIKLYYDGVLKYSQIYSGTIGSIDTFSIRGRSNVELDTSSIQLSIGQ
jgi:hypothetical protein